MIARRIALGAIAGAVGTVALNVATYLDMSIRGRPASEVPARVAATVADSLGADLGNEQTAPNRRAGIGALLGYANGLGTGILLGLLSPLVGRLPVPLASVVVGGAAMAGSDVTSTTLGASDPRTWGASGWLADIGPHLTYGFFTVVAFRWLSGRMTRTWLHF
jgi:hypothetical protein